MGKSEEERPKPLPTENELRREQASRGSEKKEVSKSESKKAKKGDG